MESIVMQKANYDISSDEGIILKFSLEDVGLLEFNKAEQLYEIGYNTTIAKIDSIKACTERRVDVKELEAKRTEYKASLPKLIFKNIHISGPTEMQKIYIERQIQKDDNNAFTIDDFRQTYFHLLTNSKIKEILPHAKYDAENKTFDLFLDILMSDEVTISFGGNISSLSANQIYLGFGYQSMTEISSSYTLDMQLGNAYNGVALEGKIEIPNKIPLDISGLLAYNHHQYYESAKLFIDTDVATFIRQGESFGKIGLGLPFRRKAKIELTIGYGMLIDQYYREKKRDFHEAVFDRSRYSLFNGGIYYTKNSLNTKQYPVTGQKHHLFAQFVSGTEVFEPEGKYTESRNNQSYIQIMASFNNYYTINKKFNLGYIIEGVVSSKNLWSNYTASVLQAPDFSPTPHSKLVFNEAFRANQYIAGGLIPIWKMNPTLQLRGDFDVFFPIYPIVKGESNTGIYGKTFTKPAYLGEVSLVAQLPFMSISLFLNHYSYPKGNWNFGLNIGYLIFGPKFIP
jgi:NTE family protein